MRDPFAPDPELQQLTQAMLDYTAHSIRRAELEYDATWLGATGPVYLINDHLARALFRDRSGRDYLDRDLLRESFGDMQWEGQFDVLDNCDQFISLTVVTPPRGVVSAECFPVADVAEKLHMTAEAMPSALWARTWWTSPILSDKKELAMAPVDPSLMSKIPKKLANGND